jgi:hypothetical protein
MVFCICGGYIRTESVVSRSRVEYICAARAYHPAQHEPIILRSTSLSSCAARASCCIFSRSCYSKGMRSRWNTENKPFAAPHEMLRVDSPSRLSPRNSSVIKQVLAYRHPKVLTHGPSCFSRSCGPKTAVVAGRCRPTAPATRNQESRDQVPDPARAL